jgi:ABC-type antimicrobial peptide transport system permease subunit
MMSFTVVRRRREIGIRAALGADPRRILTSIFGRASAQLAAGVVIGLLLALAFGPAFGGEGLILQKGIVLFPVVAGTIMLVGLLAALGPARQGLSIQPTEALREE